MQNLNDNRNNESIVLCEYSAVKTELSNLFQKSGILLTIVVLFLGGISGLFGFLVSHYNDLYLFGLLLLIFPIMAIFSFLLILFPKLKKHPRSKYFLDFANIEEKDIESEITKLNEMITLENVQYQIIINSKILVKKYKYYKIGLMFTFFLIPLFFMINKNGINSKSKT